MNMMGPEDSEETDLTGIENWVEEMRDTSKIDYSYGRFDSQAGCQWIRSGGQLGATEGLMRVTIWED